MNFNQYIKQINDVLEQHGKKIEKQKLFALGKRNQLYEEVSSREKREMELKTLIKEKRQELDRLKNQFNSLQQIENEQKRTIEKLSNNEE